VQADTAVTPEIIEENYPFSRFKGGANVHFSSRNSSGKGGLQLLLHGGGESLGPILMGLSKTVHVLQRGAEVNEIVNMAAIAVVDAQEERLRQIRG
jgi:malate dehydrogenase (oxaloacetate-decarboxylating)(NADP+)